MGIDVKTPRFYVDYLTYFDAMGWIEKVWPTGGSDITMEGYPIGLNPYTKCVLRQSELAQIMMIKVTFKKRPNYWMLKNITWSGTFGHNLAEPPTFAGNSDGTEYDFGEVGDTWGDRLHCRPWFDAADETIFPDQWDFWADNEEVNFADHYMGLHSGTDDDGQTDINASLFIGNTPAGAGFRTYPFNGWSMWYSKVTTGRKFSMPDVLNWRFSRFGNEESMYWSHKNLQLNCIATGCTYTMPHSPDMRLEMAIEHDGVKRHRTQGGHDYTNINYSGAPTWGKDSGGNEAGAWELYRRENWNESTGAAASEEQDTDGDGEPDETVYTGYGEPTGNFYNQFAPRGQYRNGRRSWKLRFSGMASDTVGVAYAHPSEDPFTGTSGITDGGVDIWQPDMHVGVADTDGDDWNWEKAYPMWNDDSFIGQVWNKCGALGLPFIFVPDPSIVESNGWPAADQYAICKFDQSSLKIKQTSFKTYQISVVIREVW